MLVGVLVLAAVGIALSRGGSATKAPVAVPGRTQQTLLVSLRGSDGSAVHSALLAHDPRRGHGSLLLVPSRVISAVPGHGTLPYGQALALPDADLSRQALADLVGVTVDGWWTLDQETLAALVDRVGGVVVDVDTDVRVPTPDGAATIVAPAGRQQNLTGSVAVSYATYLAAGEEEIARLPRFQAVLTGLLRALAPNVAAATTTLQAVGPALRASMPTPALAELLAGCAADVSRGELAASTLAVRRIDTGAPDPAYGIDRDAVRTLVDRELADSVPPGARAGDNRVLVLNGVGTPGVGEAARARLQPAGFVPVGSRNAPNFDYARSQVLVFDDTPAARVHGSRVAAALGLPADTAVAYSPQAQSIADVIVILGRDFSA